MNTKKYETLGDYIFDPPPKTPRKRGGPQPGSGRPEKPPEQKFKRAQITMTPEHFAETAKDRSGMVRRALELYFSVPSKSRQVEMVSKGFTIGLPVEAGWYLVAASSNDEQEHYFVHQVWFNPMSLDKFYTGAGSITKSSEPYYLRQNVRAYAPVPSFTTTP